MLFPVLALVDATWPGRICTMTCAYVSRTAGCQGMSGRWRFHTIRVLVTDANTPKALAIVRSLGETFEVWTASKSPVGLARWSKYAAKHLVQATEMTRDFPLWVRAVCEKNGITMVIPPEEESSYLLAAAKASFEERGILVLVPPLLSLWTAMDKALTVKAAKESGVPTPMTLVPGTKSDANRLSQELGFPMVVKPRYSHYWDGNRFWRSGGVHYVTSPSELSRVLDEWPTTRPLPLLQSFIPGKGKGMFLLMGPDGKVCAEFAHERLRDLHPTGSGSVLRRAVSVDSVLREHSVRLLRHIGWSGVAMVEFRVDAHGSPYLMEINGRFWGSLQLAIDSGVDFPSLLVRLTCGESVDPPSYQEGAVLRWWLGDLIRLARVLRGRPKGFTGHFPSRASGVWEFVGPQPKGTRNEILRWNDPLPAVGEAISAVAEKWKGSRQ